MSSAPSFMESYVVQSDLLGSELISIDIEAGCATTNGTSYKVYADRTHRLWIIQTAEGELPAAVECEPTGTVRVTIRGYTYTLHCYPARYADMLKKIHRAERNDHSMVVLRAPMPGLVKAIHISEGAMVRRGESIIVLEAMKMENLLRAPTTGVVRSINVRDGTAVEKGDVLCMIECDGQRQKTD